MLWLVVSVEKLRYSIEVEIMLQVFDCEVWFISTKTRYETYTAIRSQYTATDLIMI